MFAPLSNSPKGTALVTSTSRRFVDLYTGSETLRGRLSPSCEPVNVGDLIAFQIVDGNPLVEKISPRKNLLQRSYFGRTKELVANADHLLLVTAPLPLFQPNFIDRVLAASGAENIPTTLLLNKNDLSEEKKETASLLSIYQSLKLPIIETCALRKDGVQSLLELLQNPSLSVVALTGLSGVGKSSLLNTVLGEEKAETGEVSSKSGQGTQTTSHPLAHKLLRQDGSELFLVDLPGVQNFGVCHLSVSELQASFPEFYPDDQRCRFDNCTHTREPGCVVLELLKEKKIADERYQSYLQLLSEIRESEEY